MSIIGVAEIDLLIANYSGVQDQISLSQINRTANQQFSNEDHFKRLFLEKHPHFKTLSEPVEKTFQYLCDAHPNNCWKVACHVFQTGQHHFTKAFLTNGVITHNAHLKLKGEGNRLVNAVWSMNFLTPLQTSSHQAKLSQLFTDAMRDQYACLMSSMTKEIEPTGEQLEALYSAGAALAKATCPTKNPTLVQECDMQAVVFETTLLREKNLNLASLHIISLKDVFLGKIFDKAIEAFASQPIENISFASCKMLIVELHKSFSKISRGTILQHLLNAVVIKHKQDSAFPAFGERIFNALIDDLASLPIKLITLEGCQEHAVRIHRFYQAVPVETIKEILIEAIARKHCVDISKE